MARHRLARGALIGLALGFALPAQASAAINVTTTQDGVDVAGQCTLREAVTAANGGLCPYRDCTGGTAGPDTINLPASSNHYILGGTPNEGSNAGGDIDIASDVTIV